MTFRLLVLGVTMFFVAGQSNALGGVLISQYEFNNNLENSISPNADNGMVAPNGTFKEGASVSTAEQYVTGVDGMANGAIFLDGQDDWIDITLDGHPGEQTPADTFLNYGPGIVSGTVMAWVKTETASLNSERWLMGNANPSDTQSFRFGWNGDQLRTESQPTDTATPYVASDDTTEVAARKSWADSSWHHIAITWRASNGVGGVYIDGSEVATPNVSGDFFNSTNAQTPWENAMAIGAYNNEGTVEGFWQGAIDDLRIYADSLSATDIQTIVDSVEIVPEPATLGLLCWAVAMSCGWRLARRELF